MELTKRLSRAEEALQKAREERDESLRANDELGRAVATKDTEIKKVWTDLMTA